MYIGIGKIFGGLMRNRARTFLTAGGIAIGVASVITVSSVGNIGKEAINRQMSDMGMDSVVVTSSDYDLWEDELEAVRSIPCVENAMPMMNCYTKTTIHETTAPTMVWGVNEDAGEIIRLDVLHGRMFNRGDVIGGERVCIVDEQLALNGYKRENIVGKTANITINGSEEEFLIIGVVSNGVNILQNMFGDLVPAFVYVPYTSLNNEISAYSFDEITVKLTDEKYADTAERKISRVVSCLADETVEVDAENLFRQKSHLTGIADTVSVGLTAIGGISLAVSGLSVMTVMLTTVRERRREIGIKKSLGARNIDIMAEFLTESALISLIGSFFGTVAGLVLFYCTRLLTGVNAPFDVFIVIVAVLFSLLSGVLFGVYPAFKASKMKPVDALREE